MNNYRKYKRTILESLENKERKLMLERLEVDLTERLKSFTNWDEYWQEVDEIITILKNNGHDLWSHDYDGNGKHLWGWDYMRMETAGFLQIRFDFNGTVKIFWREDNPQLGIKSKDN
ncbi:hypothetical protein [Tenacibaculum mesophilum]|uniref:hypothetical protein n=1 Tax=Tenacibaculum mesophilum TaxID=104268 RepID=UPI0012E4A698|nr:hypothetical protein [Tenacibaculum mesophilum]GFD83784.1 hypothetical protein KUL118_66460 [Tenacibaculum sp. KUL118]